MRQGNGTGSTHAELFDEAFSGEDLVAAMDGAARQLIRRGGVEDAAERIVGGAIAVIPPVTQAGISLVEQDGTVRPHAPSSDVVAELDQLQTDLGEGPCLQATHERARIEVTDMAGEARWPRWAAAARERGIGSMLSFHLFSRDGSAGALNLYAPDAEAFDADAHHLGGLFASHAASALYGAQEIAHLNVALASRDEIGQAKGILMERFSLTGDGAFDLLVRSSQDTNVKLVTVARFLIEQVSTRPA